MYQFKFRGITIDSRFHKAGKVVFGNSLDYFMGENDPQIGRDTANGWETIPVNPDSICLILIDEDGRIQTFPIKPESPLKHNLL